MGKKRVFLILIWLLAGISFLIEQVYLNGYLIKTKLETYSEKSGELLESIDKKISAQVSSGQFNYTLWAQGQMTDELTILKAIHILIKDVLIISSDFHLLAGSTNQYSNSDLAEILGKFDHKSQSMKLVRQLGYFHIYPVSDEGIIKGYIVVVLDIPVALNAGCAYVMDISRNNLYCNKSDYLSAGDTEILYKTLLKNALGTEGRNSLETSDPREIYWNFYEPHRIYFGYIIDKKPIYLHIYVYITAICLFLSLILLFSGKKPKADKFAAYEQIIENNIKTLTEMKKGMEQLLQEPPREKIIEIESAREISEREVSAEDSDNLVTGFYHRPESAGTETGITEFILLDPLDTRWYKPLKQRYKLPQKYAEFGKEAFSEELLSLMREVSGDEIEEKKETVPGPGEESFRKIQKDPLASSLERLYNTDDMGEELEIGIEYVRTYGNADGIAVLFFNQQAGCYMIEMSSGLDQSWNRYFYILSKDSILPMASDGSTNLVISEKEIQNPFFRKRIPPEYIGRLGAIKLLPVSSENILVRIALLYFNDGNFFKSNSGKISSALLALDNAKFYNYFKETLPAFGRVYLEKQEAVVNPEEPYKDIYNILKSFTMTSEREVLIVHAIFEKVLDIKFREDLKEKFRTSLYGNEKYIVNNPHHLIFLVNKTSPDDIEKILNDMGGKFEISTLRFPELGKNLFAYI
jgi:hypothetical protein